VAHGVGHLRDLLVVPVAEAGGVNPAEPIFDACPFLVIYTIYHSPLDYPGEWIVRRVVVRPYVPVPIPEPVACRCRSLNEAREPFIHSGLHRMPRWPNDEPQIVETWM
jgi:hypothetical protein